MCNVDGGLKDKTRLRQFLEYVKIHRPHAICLTELQFADASKANPLISELSTVLGYIVKCSFKKPLCAGNLLAFRQDLVIEEDPIKVYTCENFEIEAGRLFFNGVNHLINNSYLPPDSSFKAYRQMTLQEAQIFLQNKDCVITSVGDKNLRFACLQEKPVKVHFTRKEKIDSFMFKAYMVREPYAFLGFGQFLPPGLDVALSTSSSVKVERAYLPIESVDRVHHASWLIKIQSSDKPVSFKV